MKTKKDLILIAVLIVLTVGAVIIVLKSLFDFSIIRIKEPYVPKYIDISREDLGSAGYLDGKTAFVSIFASDTANKWDFSKKEDSERREVMLSYLPIAADWLTGQGKKNGKSLSFVYAESSEDELLCYEANFTDQELLAQDTYKAYNKVAGDEWEFIAENIPSERITETYGCDNVVYLFFLNSPEKYPFSPMALSAYDKPPRRPYELVWLPCDQVVPAVIAHETLHLFGAPDYYTPDLYKISYEIDYDFCDYIAEHYPDDIMLSTYDAQTGERLKDRVTREITELTAYYIGWLDTPPVDLDGFEAVHSQFEKRPQ